MSGRKAANFTRRSGWPDCSDSAAASTGDEGIVDTSYADTSMKDPWQEEVFAPLRISRTR